MKRQLFRSGWATAASPRVLSSAKGDEVVRVGEWITPAEVCRAETRMPMDWWSSTGE
jgi:hypothetical protein